MTRYPNTFNLLFNHVTGMEGGVANNPNDHGGLTNRGITYGTYQGLSQAVLGVPPTQERFYALTTDQQKLFLKYFWDDVKADKINDSRIAATLTEWAWGAGEGGAEKALESRTFKDLIPGFVPDANNYIDDKDIAKINNLIATKGGDTLFTEMYNNWRKRYQDIVANNPSQAVFINGWLRRVDTFYNLFKKKAKE